MLRLQPKVSFIPETNIKCGEIYCQSFRDFTIFCTLCQMKSFLFEDFTLHVQNVHMKRDFQKTLPVEINELKDVKNQGTDILENCLETKGKDLAKSEKNGINAEEDVPSWNEREWTMSNSSDDESWVEDNLKVLKKPKKKIKFKSIQKTKQDQKNAELNNLQKQTNLKTPNESSTRLKPSKINYFHCAECPETFLQKRYLDEHVRNLHNGYKCSLCDKRFNRTSHVECHLKTHTTEKKFICPMKNCSRGFIDEDYLKRHLEVHTMERNFICEYEHCGKAFQTQRRLASHEYTHKIPKKFVCDMCGYSCRSNPQLTTHQRVHTGEKPFPCEICKKPFISKVALQEHMISHSELRPHVCSICNRAFANRRVLVRHSFIHTDEKTFKCKLCESAFKHPNSLQGHMRHVHREPKLKS